MLGFGHVTSRFGGLYKGGITKNCRPKIKYFVQLAVQNIKKYIEPIPATCGSGVFSYPLRHAICRKIHKYS